jgi:hypothetical protein
MSILLNSVLDIVIINIYNKYRIIYIRIVIIILYVFISKREINS